MEKQIIFSEAWTSGLAESLLSVRLERIRQLEKWGPQTHDLTTWSTILGEEYGELCQEILRHKFDHKIPSTQAAHLKRAREEAVQIAAVALAIVQYLDGGIA